MTAKVGWVNDCCGCCDTDNYPIYTLRSVDGQVQSARANLIMDAWNCCSYSPRVIQNVSFLTYTGRHQLVPHIDKLHATTFTSNISRNEELIKRCKKHPITEENCSTGSLTLLFKIFKNSDHPLPSKLAPSSLQSHFTRFASDLSDLAFSTVCFNTFQFSRSFVTCKTNL